MAELNRTFVTPSRAYEALCLLGCNVESSSLPRDDDERVSAYLAIARAVVESLLIERSVRHPDLIRMYYRRTRIRLDPETDAYHADAALAAWTAAAQCAASTPALPRVDSTADTNPLSPWFRQDAQ